MSSNPAVQHRYIDAGVTTIPKRELDSAELSFSRFWEEYYSRLDRKLEKIWPQLAELTQYQAGWDSYRALPLRQETAQFALQVLHTIMKPDTPLPQVVPVSDGGVQFEWHEKNIDLELHIAAPYECELWFSDHLQGQVYSKTATNDFSDLKLPIELLTSR